MTVKAATALLSTPSIQVDVVEPGLRGRPGWEKCEIGTNLDFCTAQMESYFFALWEPVLYDALLVAAAVEFCDISLRRTVRHWERDIELRIPVHEPDRWNAPEVLQSLHGALSFLTGDRWAISFTKRCTPQSSPRQGQFALPNDIEAVIPFSDGLDSRSVAGLSSRQLGDKLVRVRLGSQELDATKQSRRGQPFTSVPYKVRANRGEPSARSRGFKFGVLSGLAAYLSGAHRVIVPESGQGSLGPTLVPLGQIHVDYRTHPLFTTKLERFLRALLGHDIRYEFPRIWHTKGQTLAAFLNECSDDKEAWMRTRSCWQQNRQIGVDHKARQCGICAACLLRRLSVHAAGQSEPATSYVWENLGAPIFAGGAARAFPREKITPAMREYAIAGAQHLDHLAGLRSSDANKTQLDLSAFQLGRALRIPESEARSKLDSLLGQHELEWKNFVGSLGPSSFLRQWVVAGQ